MYIYIPNVIMYHKYMYMDESYFSSSIVERDYSGSPLKVNTVFACPCDYLAMSRPSLCNCAIWPGIDVIIRSKRWA